MFAEQNRWIDLTLQIETPRPYPVEAMVGTVAYIYEGRMKVLNFHFISNQRFILSLN
jgi:hypothetical protein